ncbi:MAG: tryptophan 7-halogenase [candidate division KSB1 bacterium]|nr:tryptophan 7-halogenase [candidate division KSB1 bacterium]
MVKDRYEVIVIGGGPAGSTTAALLAQYGREVLLLERDKFPRFKIGESLMPGTYWTLKRIGVLNKMKASHFPKKYSVQFFSKSGKASMPFYFFENDPHESSITWQVLRSEFDQLMLDNVTEKGGEVWQETSVHEVLFEGERAIGVRAKRPDGSSVDLFAKVIVDATGQSALLSRHLKIHFIEPNLKMGAIYSHFKGAQRDAGIDEGATLVMHTEGAAAWFWYIPLPNEVVSVGVVGPIEYLLKNRREEAQEIFESEIKRCPPLPPRLAEAQQLFPVKVTKDFSYRASQIAGPGWVLVGDAFGFLDPIYSSGVFLALSSGEMAAEAIQEAFLKNDFSGRQLGKFGERFVAGMEAIRKIVYAFYTKDFSFARFLKQFPDCRQDIINLLSGNVYRTGFDGVFEAMSTMCELPEEKALIW